MHCAFPCRPAVFYLSQTPDFNLRQVSLQVVIILEQTEKMGKGRPGGNHDARLCRRIPTEIL